MRKAKTLPELPDRFVYRLDLRHHVTPRLLKNQPVHRWFWFPHSFSPQLIDEVLRAYPLPPTGRILDPFVGAGTTVVRARQLGYHAIGADLSPISIFVSQVKLSHLSVKVLQEYLQYLLQYAPAYPTEPLPERMRRAFTREEIAHLFGIKQRIETLPPVEANFFRLALLRVQQRVSRAISNGGWFRWVEKRNQSGQIAAWFKEQSLAQIMDITPYPDVAAEVFLDDARCLKRVEGPFDMVITSPPYPNRHDYSRVFHIELLFLGLDEEEIKHLRRQSLRSHVEASASPSHSSVHLISPILQKTLKALPSGIDSRVVRMLQGYFEDMYLTLEALARILRPGALCAFVVGNVRHMGIMVPVDEILREVGEQAGYTFEGAWVVRLRGNSAQQMGRFGRQPARESILFLRR